MWFQSDINVFSSFAIGEGPLYVERVFEWLLAKDGIPAARIQSAPDRYRQFIDFLEGRQWRMNRQRSGFALFYLGYFYQLLARQGMGLRESRRLEERSLCHYESFLKFPPMADERAFYARWQSGCLLAGLGYPWVKAEAMLLSAYTADKWRGESIRRIVRHYIALRNWSTAWRYSEISVRQFLDRNPIATRRWRVEPDAYNQRLLHTHAFLCQRLGYKQELQGTKLIHHDTPHLQPG